MFTGIIETTGQVFTATEDGSSRHFWIDAPAYEGQLKIDQSVAHNGVCLTVVDIRGSQYKVTAVAETLSKTTLGTWTSGMRLNLERGLRLGDRLDGHFVQGHVDAVCTCIKAEAVNGSWLFRFRFPEAFGPLLIEKGSVCLNGVSLTVFDVTADAFSVTIIPYTYEHTNFNELAVGDALNIEFDVLGKYFLRSQQLQSN
jgi:riboflavin synthase